ncbi:hypothetical protein Tco_0953747 [Tanacetum coccineum]|uniref:Uncharacterized protein n=1 Tax=Tanacetum coccineum TaxID=301880 RepID=A0ABQ5E2Z6_9ASTR
MRKEFKRGNKVLLFHSKYKFKQPKLRSRWLGPYVVKHQYPSGYVELYGKDGKTFIVNGHRLKLYHEEEDYNDQREALSRSHISLCPGVGFKRLQDILRVTVAQLQSLVDVKKIIITEASVRCDLQLNDEEGTDCLPNATIFEELTRMGAKTTAWNEFSSTMTSVIICLAINQKFNFSKYLFESMVKNLKNVSGKFLMYPRFVQVFLEKQLEGMLNHKRIYVIPSHIKKIFGNMRRVGKGFFGRETPLFPTMMVQAQEEMGEDSVNPIDPHHTSTIIQPSTSQPQKKQKPRKPKRKDTEVPQPSGPIYNVVDEVVYKEIDDSLERAATTGTSLDAEQDRGNINKTQSKAILNEPSSLGTSSCSGPRRQETMRDTIAQTGFENVSKTSNDLLLTGVNTPRSDEDRLKIKELMELCTNLQKTVINSEKTKTSQAKEITSLKRRIKRLEKKGGSRTYGLKRIYKGRIADIDADAGINLVSTHFYADTNMFGVHYLVGDEVVVETKVASKDVNLSVDEVTLAQALAALKTVSTRPRAKGLVIHEEEQATTPTVSSQQPSQLNVQDKAEKEEEANIVSWDYVQAMIDVDYQMAQQMQAEEQEKLSIEEKSKLFVQLLEARKKHFAAIRAKEKRNKPPTKAQKRNTMSTYLKNMAGCKHNQLKNKSFDDIQKLFDKAMKRVNTFVDMNTKLVEGSEVRAEAEITQESSSKRAGEALEQESSKKQKVEEEEEERLAREKT